MAMVPHVAEGQLSSVNSTHILSALLLCTASKAVTVYVLVSWHTCQLLKEIEARTTTNAYVVLNSNMVK